VAPRLNPEPLRVAVRAYTTVTTKGAAGRGTSRRRPSRRKRPHRTLILDTETTTDASQRLNFGCYRYYVDRWDLDPGVHCVEEGVFYADDLAERDPQGFEVLAAYAQHHSADVAPGSSTTLRFLPRAQFVEQLIWQHGFKDRATIVGFNLPFDLTRLAIAATPARKSYIGGNSLQLFSETRYRPRIAYRALDSRRSLIGFTTPDGVEDRFRGNFLDLRTLSFALTDRSHSLESACTAFNVPFQKRSVVHGSISEDYVTYCREDVGATAALFRGTSEEYRRHPIEREATKAFSPASIGKSYLEAIGVRPILERQPDLDPAILGRGMAAFFGGRAECRIRRVPLPVVYVDFLSMYPTVNALMRTWDLVTAGRIELEDVTDQVRELVQGPNLAERCFDRDLWRQLCCLVEIEPHGDVLPIRAAYDPASPDFGIGVNPYHLDGSAWYTLGDVVASVLLSGTVPSVRRAIALGGVGILDALKPAKVRGMVGIDPAAGDFFRRVIELRREVQAVPGLTDIERDRLAGFLKVLANSTSYGIAAEFVRQEVPNPVTVIVRSGDTEFTNTTGTPEEPGPFCFPPLAAVITGAARLMLAVLEREVTNRGGSYVFCDTDSMAIVADKSGALHLCPGGDERKDNDEAVRALTWDEVGAIVQQFSGLNPYDRSTVPGSILEIESENVDPTGNRRQLWCFAISSKRYVLYSTDRGAPQIERIEDTHEEMGSPDGEDLAKTSEHGLGHLLNPLDPEDPSKDWIEEAWRLILHRAIGLNPDEPRWLNRPALTRVTASGPAVLRWFEAMNEGASYAEQIKPANFLLLAHPHPLDASDALPIAPYESDPSKWDDLDWIDRRTGEPVSVTIEPSHGVVRPGVVRVRTYRDVLNDYVGHPEAKSLGPDSRVVGRRTVGLLLRRPVEGVRPAVLIGKEGNRIDDRLSGLVTDTVEYRSEYVDPEHTFWKELVVPVLSQMNRTHLANDSKLDRRTIQRQISGTTRPHLHTRQLLTQLAIEHARTELVRQEETVPGDPMGILQRFVQRRALKDGVDSW
jgi:hypothetical protein